MLRAVFFCSSVIMLSYGLTALALSLGALLPNFREPNPARIISGISGTLYLIVSFLFILESSAAQAIPDALAWQAALKKVSNASVYPLGITHHLGFCGLFDSRIE